MNRKTFIDEYTALLKVAMKLADKAQKNGIAALEDELEDLDEELFKQGLRFAVDGTEPRLIDEIMSNRIAHEKDKHMRLLKAVQKRATLGIQAGESLRVFYYVLLSIPGLTRIEEKGIEKLVLLRD
jgi:flagellar motor component MotA